MDNLTATLPNGGRLGHSAAKHQVLVTAIGTAMTRMMTKMMPTITKTNNYISQGSF
jgi:hypothetical protein